MADFPSDDPSARLLYALGLLAIVTGLDPRDDARITVVRKFADPSVPRGVVLRVCGKEEALYGMERVGRELRLFIPLTGDEFRVEIQVLARSEWTAVSVRIPTRTRDFSHERTIRGALETVREWSDSLGRFFAETSS